MCLSDPYRIVEVFYHPPLSALYLCQKGEEHLHHFVSTIVFVTEVKLDLFS